jgi:hypothetical protein
MNIFNSGTKEIKKLITIHLLRRTMQNVKNGFEIDTSFLITYNMYHLMYPDQIVAFFFIFFVRIKQHLVQIVSLMIEIVLPSKFQIFYLFYLH